MLAQACILSNGFANGGVGSQILRIIRDALNAAFPLLAQVEANVTTCDVLTGEPVVHPSVPTPLPLQTITLTLVVPNAERGEAEVLPLPSVGVVRVTVEAPIE